MVAIIIIISVSSELFLDLSSLVDPLGHGARVGLHTAEAHLVELVPHLRGSSPHFAGCDEGGLLVRLGDAVFLTKFLIRQTKRIFDLEKSKCDNKTTSMKGFCQLPQIRGCSWLQGSVLRQTRPLSSRRRWPDSEPRLRRRLRQSHRTWCYDVGWLVTKIEEK